MRLPLPVLFSLLLASPAFAGGDAARGRALLGDRQKSLCLLCHAAPDGVGPLQGNLAPGLHGVGSRYDAAELRHHLEAPQDFNPETIMPSYSRSQGLDNVGHAFQGQPILSPAALDDLVAYLASLKDAP